jgi:hypothetical protein
MCARETKRCTSSVYRVCIVREHGEDETTTRVRKIKYNEMKGFLSRQGEQDCKREREREKERLRCRWTRRIMHRFRGVIFINAMLTPIGARTANPLHLKCRVQTKKKGVALVNFKVVRTKTTREA